jgi:hypothetical protein
MILSHILVENWLPRRFLLLLPAFMRRDSVFIATQGRMTLSSVPDKHLM